MGRVKEVFLETAASSSLRYEYDLEEMGVGGDPGKEALENVPVLRNGRILAWGGVMGLGNEGGTMNRERSWRRE